ncbi:hypothetical protein DdX_16551 [Ditylenchus destructor]|uniref:Uncharacterized protein n=1 Tax=Ditylenchus destructor TaxID=166010 RepID=A0AAD4QZU4_9BILA|nr:hypothetical protein DdX_16551 [Ditylenchus destructor]
MASAREKEETYRQPAGPDAFFRMDLGAPFSAPSAVGRMPRTGTTVYPTPKPISNSESARSKTYEGYKISRRLLQHLRKFIGLDLTEIATFHDVWSFGPTPMPQATDREYVQMLAIQNSGNLKHTNAFAIDK